MLGQGIDDTLDIIGNSIREKYFRGVNQSSIPEVAEAMSKLLGVISFQAPAWKTASLISQSRRDRNASNTTTPLYFYSFEFNCSGSMTSLFPGETLWDYGVTHGDELLLQFDFTQSNSYYSKFNPWRQLNHRDQHPLPLSLLKDTSDPLCTHRDQYQTLY